MAQKQKFQIVGGTDSQFGMHGNQVEPPANDPTHGGGGGGGGNITPMEARLAKLEATLPQLQTDLAVLKSNYATKADVAEAKNSIIMWVVSAILLAQLLPPLLKKFGL